MMRKRPAGERGHANHGWLDTYFTFSFAHYMDPEHMGFRTLRVLNDDTIQPARGFGMHAHADMEILTYVLDGALEHRDSAGHRGVLRPGDVQRMSAGRGIQHSEYNASDTEPLHLLQIWILPEHAGLDPGYEERHFPVEERRGRLRLLAAREPGGEALTIHQDAAVYAAVLEPGERVAHALAPGRGAWVHVARGQVALRGDNGAALELAGGDGAAVSEVRELTLEAAGASELLLFDLA